jgi:hypothetical protein
MVSRFFAPVLPFHLCQYPNALDVRSNIASLTTSHSRIMAVKDLRHDLTNAICIWIIEDLIKITSTHSLPQLRALCGLEMHMRHESRLRLQAEAGSLNLMGTKLSAGITVNMLKKLAANFTLNEVPDDARLLWQELADWFCGKYQSIASKTNRREIKRNLIGSYPFIDTDDRIFWLFTNTKLFDFTMPLYQVAGIINQRIASLYPVLPCAPPQEIEASAPPLTDNELSETSESSVRPEFECPLTLKTMKAPAICTLDGISYEAAVLQACIERHDKTPTNIFVDKTNIHNIILLNINLQHAIQHYRADESEVDCYCCTITGELMKEAMFCTLDRISYDKIAIHKYLTQHKSTPGGMLLPDNKQAHEVLVPNITLRNAILNCAPQQAMRNFKRV